MQEEQAHPLGTPRVEVSDAQPTMSPYMVGLQVIAFPAAGLQIILNFIDAAVTGGGRESG